MDKQQFIERYASGSLQKAWGLGLSVNDLLYKEYVAFQFGWYFEPIKTSRITQGQVLMEGDSPAHTEYVWHLKRWRHFNTTVLEPHYLIIEDPDGSRREGLGVIARPSVEERAFVPECFSIVALMSEFKDGKFSECHPI